MNANCFEKFSKEIGNEEYFGYEAKYKSYHPKWAEEGIMEQALRSIKEHIDKFDIIPGLREWENIICRHAARY